MIKGVHIVNPGALGGLARGQRSFCIVDLDTNDVEFITVPFT
jgi:predicted phosphodiesterase